MLSCFKTCHTVCIMHIVGSCHIDRVHLFVPEKLLIGAICPGNSVFPSESLRLFPGTGTAGRQSVLPLHSIYCFSELCRYGAGCQDCPIHKRCLQLFYLCSMFHQIHSEARMKHTLMLHLVFLPVHVSVRPGQRAPQAHILTRVKEGISGRNAGRKYIPVAVSLHSPLHGQNSTGHLLLSQTV